MKTINKLTPATLEFTKPVESLSIFPGQFVTLFLHGRADVVQLEARVLLDGTVELFADNATLRPFKEWTP